MNMILFLYLTLLVDISSSLLCNSSEYTEKIEQKLKNRIGDRYSIIKGNVVWLQNFTKYFNNPSGIYGIYEIPYSSQVTVFGFATSLHHVLVSNNIYFYIHYNPYSSQVTMNDGCGDLLFHCHDAIVFAGCTPPQSRYYSVVSYLFNRFNMNNTRNNYEETWIFASLGASLNHLLVNTTNGTNGSFNALTTVVHTGDNMTFTNIYNALYDEKQSYNDINLQIIPNDYFHFAPYDVNPINFATYPLTFDSYLAAWRIAIPSNKKEYNQYINMNQTVFYLKYIPHDIDENRPYKGYKNESTNPYSPYLFNETKIYYNELNEYSKDLIKNICLTYNYSFINTIHLDPIQNTGYQCIDIAKNCWGDNRDAVYWDTAHGAYYNLTDKDYYIVVGVNSYNNNLTVYQNIAYYIKHGNVEGESSKFAITNFEYFNTAIDLNIATSVNQSSLKNLWLIQFARPITFIPNIMGFNISYNDVNSTQQFAPSIRDYLNPITKTRPYSLDLVSPIFLKFKTNY